MPMTDKQTLNEDADLEEAQVAINEWEAQVDEEIRLYLAAHKGDEFDKDFK